MIELPLNALELHLNELVVSHQQWKPRRDTSFFQEFSDNSSSSFTAIGNVMRQCEFSIVLKNDIMHQKRTEVIGLLAQWDNRLRIIVRDTSISSPRLWSHEPCEMPARRWD